MNKDWLLNEEELDELAKDYPLLDFSFETVSIITQLSVLPPLKQFWQYVR